MAHGQLTQPKRGYLANILIIPPLIYPFQYNPTSVVDEKKLEWKKKEPLYKTRGLEGFATGVRADLAAFKGTPGVKISEGTEFFKRLGSGYGKTLGTATEVLGRTFSAGELKQFDKENPRTLSFKFSIDGRELQAGEPARRRNNTGDILGDLAVIRSFAYPQFASDLEILGALGTAAPEIKGNDPVTLANLWFNHPPTMTLVLGDLSCEGFLEEMKITVTHFNEDLNPVHADVEIKMTEKIDTLSFALDSVKRLGRMAYHSSYTDIPRVLGF
jgi:hypothetical protein